MHRIHLTYALGDSGDSPRELHHPLMRLLDAIHVTGSISGAARELDLSYRHVWGELKRWEQELGQDLVVWSKGQPARLSQFGEKLLWAERRAKARLAPQIDALRSELERAFAIAFDPHAEVLTLYASHDNALPLLRETAARDDLHLDMRFTGSTEALQALNRGVCTVAGFHAHVHSPLRSPTAQAYRPLLKPGRHKLIGFARRTQGLIVAPGNPAGIHALADLTRGGLRFVNRPWGRAPGSCWSSCSPSSASPRATSRDSTARSRPTTQSPKPWPAAAPTWPSASSRPPGNAAWTSCRSRRKAISWSRCASTWSNRNCSTCAASSRPEHGRSGWSGCAATRATAAARCCRCAACCPGGATGGRRRSGRAAHQAQLRNPQKMSSRSGRKKFRYLGCARRLRVANEAPRTTRCVPNHGRE